MRNLYQALIKDWAALLIGGLLLIAAAIPVYDVWPRGKEENGDEKGVPMMGAAVALGFVAAGVIATTGGVVGLVGHIREVDKKTLDLPPMPSVQLKFVRAITLQRIVKVGMAMLQVKNSGPTTAVQIQVEKLEGITPLSNIDKRLLAFPYTAPWLSASDKVRDIDWSQRRERRLISGSVETIGLATAWGNRLQLWGTDFHDGHIWTTAGNRKPIRFHIAVLRANGSPVREVIEFRRTKMGWTMPKDVTQAAESVERRPNRRPQGAA